MSTALIYDPRYLQHDTGPGHVERPERISAIAHGLQRKRLWERLVHLQPGFADPAVVELVHPAAYIEGIMEACRGGALQLDADTVISPASYEVALLAVGGVLAACDAVMAGEVRNAFCAVRPPGHHAERSQAMGFCLFNNVAIAARYLQRNHGIERVLIFDWDVHHGNGTQHIFEDDPSVFYISIHQHPLYPGTGRAAERGVGAGRGRTLNIPLPAGSGDAEYRAAVEIAEEEIATFAPEVVLVSAGFDAHRLDPLAGMELSEAGFRWMMNRMLNIADLFSHNRLVAVLEGGYDLGALASSVAACIEEMLTFESTG